MNENKGLPKQMPDTEFEFTIDVEGNFTRKKISGNFKFSIPTNKSRTRADRYRTELDGPFPQNLDASTRIWNHMISYLRYSLVHAPQWWVAADFGNDTRDTNVVEEVYNRCEKFESDYLKTVWGDMTPAEEPAAAEVSK